ncbi:unnamed protein product [Toxocara canis]|uniref:SAP domain-containing protein n=1 Tax=Toxocara canis TaxID=6265 RepID=A0A183UIY8_TOXCA|nr:unnamed protein product [Toxocara canis]
MNEANERLKQAGQLTGREIRHLCKRMKRQQNAQSDSSHDHPLMMVCIMAKTDKNANDSPHVSSPCNGGGACMVAGGASKQWCTLIHTPAFVAHPMRTTLRDTTNSYVHCPYQTVFTADGSVKTTMLSCNA